MSGSKKIPLGHIARVVVRKRGARKAKYFLVSGSLAPEALTDDVEVVKTFEEYQSFALPVRDTEFGNEPPLVVHYRIIRPGALARSRLTPEYWDAKKEAFLSSFAPRVKAFRKDTAGTLSTLEETGEMVRLANSAANGCDWNVSIFGVGRSIDMSDPFTI
jgi:hypothetical protein